LHAHANYTYTGAYSSTYTCTLPNGRSVKFVFGQMFLMRASWRRHERY